MPDMVLSTLHVIAIQDAVVIQVAEILSILHQIVLTAMVTEVVLGQRFNEQAQKERIMVSILIVMNLVHLLHYI